MRNAKYRLNEFVLAQTHQQKVLLHGNSDKGVVKWDKPTELVVKANWDAAIDAQHKRVGITVVIRDSEGEMLAYLCSTIEYTKKLIVAEALALRRAAILCRVGPYSGRLSTGSESS